MQIGLILYVRRRSLTIDFSAASDRISAILGSLESSHRGESESGVGFVVSAFVKKTFNAQNSIKIKLQMLIINLHKIEVINLI